MCVLVRDVPGDLRPATAADRPDDCIAAGAVGKPFSGRRPDM